MRMVDQTASQPGLNTQSNAEDSSPVANELRARLSVASQKVEELTDALRDRDDELEVLRDEIATLRQEHARVLGSTSWRVTGPLRKLRGGA